MDPELMQLMARFKLRMRRSLDRTVDTYRFLEDREYALEVLKIADASDDEDLILLSFNVSDRMGLLPKSGRDAAGKGDSGPSSGQKQEKPKSRYMYGARG